MSVHQTHPSGSMPLRRRVNSRSEKGSTIAVGMVSLAVLAMIGAATFLTVSNRFRSNYQTASWHDALTSAETGAQYAFTRLRSPLTNSTNNLVNPATLPGTLQYDLANLSAGSTSTNGTVLTATYNGTSYTRIQLPTVTIPHSGQGSNLFSAVVTIDAIPAANLTNSGTNSWYRIQSVGTVPLSGPPLVGIQKYDNFLRKLQFIRNGAGQTVTTPQAVRTVEVIARPVTFGSAALFGQTGINLNNQNVVIDSYDSRSASTSSNGTVVNGVYSNGTYDPTKATKNANVVTDDQDNSSGTPGVINLSPTGAYVYGNISTNNTAVQGSTSDVSGTITENFYQTLPLPPNPTTVSSLWTQYSSGNISTGTASSPTYYEINGDLKLSGNSSLTIQAPTDGSQGYVQIWINGNLSTSGNAQITVPNNVHATFYVYGSVSITGNGIANNSLIPENVIFYGLPTAPSTPDTSNQTMTFNGNAEFSGIIYAPNADVTVKGGGSAGEMIGAIFANNIFFNGGTTLHYDTALGDAGAVIDYRGASWYEDNQLTRQ